MTDLVEELLEKYHFQLDPKSNFYQHKIHADKNDELGNDVVLDIL